MGSSALRCALVQAPGQGQRGSGEGLKALVQSQVKFNRVPEKVPEKVPGSLGAKPSQVQQGCRESSGGGSRKPWKRPDLHRNLLRNPVEPDVALHQSLPGSPEPC